MRLRSYLGILVLAGVAPLIVLTVIVTTSLVRQQRAAVDRGLADTVAALATAVENELETSIKSLETLATSQRLDSDDLPAFYEQARRVRDLHHWSTMGLIDSAGNHRLNVMRPLGASLPDLRDRDYFKQVLATERPYVSDLLRGRVTDTLDFAVAVPVLRGGRVKYVLFAGVNAATFGAVFEAQLLPPQAVAFIVSRDSVFIARSPHHGRFVGRPPPAEYVTRISQALEGQFRGSLLHGEELESAFKRMPLTGWTVGFGLPADAVTAPVRHIAWTGAAVGGGIAIAVLGLAAIFARRMATAINLLGSAASGLGRGEPLDRSEPLRVAELERMRRFLADADRLLQERARERDDLLASEQAARAEAEASSRAKDEFLAMLGHELRNPIGAIGNAVHVLDLVGKPDQATDSARAVISRQVRHLTRLVDDLLDVGRVTTGKIVLHPRPVDLAELVTRQLKVLNATVGDGYRIVVETESVWVDGDETRLEQVVGNLLVNAFKYTPRGETVRVTVSRDGAEAVLRVADTGVGIGPELLPHIFDLFVQGKRGLDRSQGGLGIGLTLVRRLVELHGGTVSAASDGPGRGSTFTVRLPRIATPQRLSPAESLRPTTASAHLRILVVEDNPDARDMLRMMLTIAGHEVHELSDGAAAVAAVARIQPDVALIDIGLPGMDGYEVARAIRASAPGRSIMLIAVTGYGAAEERRRGLDIGFDAYLVKPVDPDRLEPLLAIAALR